MGRDTRLEEDVSGINQRSQSQVLELFSGTVATGTETTGTHIFVNGQRDITIIVDLSGSVNTAVLTPTIDVRGGVSGFVAFTLLRSVTATADQALPVFRLGDPAASTGGSVNATGAISFNDIWISVHNSGTVTGGGVTCRARAILPKV